MNHSKKVVITLSAVILWVVGLIFLTQIILITNNRTAKKTDIDLNKADQNSVVFAIEKISSSQNLFKDVKASGWAFVEFEGKNPDKKLSLIFVSEEVSYAFEMQTFDRIDLNTAPTLANFLVPKYRDGFEGSFSPLTMKNGNYRLFIYAQENEELNGLVDTGREYTKHFGSFTERVGGEEIATVKDIPNSDLYVNSQFLCNVFNSKVLVEGWAFVENGDIRSVPSKPIIKLLKSDGGVIYYSTVSMSRVDVANEFEDRKLLLSGFSAQIPIESLGTGKNTFSIIFDGLAQSILTCEISLP